MKSDISIITLRQSPFASSEVLLLILRVPDAVGNHAGIHCIK